MQDIVDATDEDSAKKEAEEFADLVGDCETSDIQRTNDSTSSKTRTALTV